MKTGNLTPKSNNPVSEFSYTGAFGQPDGFGSILNCRIAKSGDATLTLIYKTDDAKEHMWSVILDNEQRRVLANQLLSYEPTLWEKII